MLDALDNIQFNSNATNTDGCTLDESSFDPTAKILRKIGLSVDDFRSSFQTICNEIGNLNSTATLAGPEISAEFVKLSFHPIATLFEVYPFFYVLFVSSLMKSVKS